MSNPKRVMRDGKAKKTTRYYSKKQEETVAKEFNGKMFYRAGLSRKKDGKTYENGYIDVCTPMAYYDDTSTLTYYLKETKVPDGYQENANVLEVTVKMKDNKVTEIDVLNVAKSNLPVTGGAGIIGVSLFGLAIVAIGVLMMSIALKLRRKELGSVA